MDLFSDRSLLTMLHGIVLSGGALLALAAALFHLYSRGTAGRGIPVSEGEGRSFAQLSIQAAILLWLAVIVGTYVVFPAYRASPPEGVTDLAEYPRALILADQGTAWLHSWAMEIKEHVPWIAAMLLTSVAFVASRYRSRFLDDDVLRRISMAMLAIAFALVSVTALLGVLINKVAPLD